MELEVVAPAVHRGGDALLAVEHGRDAEPVAAPAGAWERAAPHNCRGWRGNACLHCPGPPARCRAHPSPSPLADGGVVLVLAVAKAVLPVGEQRVGALRPGALGQLRGGTARITRDVVTVSSDDASACLPRQAARSVGKRSYLDGRLHRSDQVCLEGPLRVLGVVRHDEAARVLGVPELVQAELPGVPRCAGPGHTSVCGGGEGRGQPRGVCVCVGGGKARPRRGSSSRQALPRRICAAHVRCSCGRATPRTSCPPASSCCVRRRRTRVADPPQHAPPRAASPLRWPGAHL